MDNRLRIRFFERRSDAGEVPVGRSDTCRTRAAIDATLRVARMVFGLSLIFSLTSADLFGQTVLNYAQSGKPESPGLELLQQEPHDIIYLTEKSGGGWVKTRLLNVPGRTMPTQPSGSLVFEIINVEREQFTVKWSEIESIDFWEQRLERETKERIAKADFKGAYPFLSVLIRDYPERAGIRQLRSEFLWTDAITRAKRGEREATLAMLEELMRYAPEYKPSSVKSAIDLTTGALMETMVQRESSWRSAESCSHVSKRIFRTPI